MEDGEGKGKERTERTGKKKDRRGGWKGERKKRKQRVITKADRVGNRIQQKIQAQPKWVRRKCIPSILRRARGLGREPGERGLRCSFVL
jgi:hypothetical protein